MIGDSGPLKITRNQPVQYIKARKGTNKGFAYDDVNYEIYAKYSTQLNISFDYILK